MSRTPYIMSREQAVELFGSHYLAAMPDTSLEVGPASMQIQEQLGTIEKAANRTNVWWEYPSLEEARSAIEKQCQEYLARNISRIEQKIIHLETYGLRAPSAHDSIRDRLARVFTQSTGLVLVDTTQSRKDMVDKSVRLGQELTRLQNLTAEPEITFLPDGLEIPEPYAIGQSVWIVVPENLVRDPQNVMAEGKIDGIELESRFTPFKYDITYKVSAPDLKIYVPIAFKQEPEHRHGDARSVNYGHTRIEIFFNEGEARERLSSLISAANAAVPVTTAPTAAL